MTINTLKIYIKCYFLSINFGIKFCKLLSRKIVARNLSKESFRKFYIFFIKHRIIELIKFLDHHCQWHNFCSCGCMIVVAAFLIFERHKRILKHGSMYSFKIKESRYIALFVVSGSVKKLSSIDYFPNGKVWG